MRPLSKYSASSAPPGDADGIAALEINGLGGGDGVVGFGFEDHAAGGGAGIEFGEFGAEGDFVARWARG
jgi:hypothetical protein